MSHKLGVYFAPSHDRPGDWDYIRNLNPPVVRILMPGDAPTNLVSRVHQTAPNARIGLRWWDVDDGGESNKRGKLNSPEASAANDAKTFFSRIQQMEFDAEESGLPFPPRNQLLVNALNEPPTWEHDKRPAIVAYNRALIMAMVPYGVPVAALCLAVGHPEEWPPKWDWAQPVIDAIRMSPGSVLELHSYWQLEGPNHIWTDAQGNQRKDWGALAGRYLHCPYDVPILMGEVAADGRLYDRKPQHTGWRGNIPAAEYAAQLRFYLEHIHQDARIIAALPFLTDTPDMESWGSFDTEQAHNDILAMVRSLPPVAAPPSIPSTPPITTHIPVVSPGAAPDLPPREWDERLTVRGVTVETPPLVPGQAYWRVAKVRWYDEQESQGRHHIYVEALDPDGKPMADVPFEVTWPTGRAPGRTNGRSGFDAGNFPMSPSRNEFSVGIKPDVDVPAETLEGIGMGAETPGGFNAGVHTSTGVIFQWATMPAVAVPAQPPTAPPTTVHLPAIVSGEGPMPAPRTYWVRVLAANLRAGPSTEYDILAELPQGTSLTFADSTPARDWFQVRYGDRGGWVMAALLSANPVAVPPPVPAPVTEDHRLEAEDKLENWERSRAFTAAWEGGYQNVANDVGNWTGGAVGVGENKGTNFGISAASYPHLDIKNLTRAQADAIYERDYWAASGSAALRWPLCLLVFDTAILHGVGTAKAWLADVGPDPYAFAAKRLRVYTKMDNWDFWGKAWVNRVAELLEEIGG